MRTEVAHGDLLGVRLEQAPELLRGGREEMAVARGLEGFQDEDDAYGIFGDTGAVGVAVVPVAGQDPAAVRVDDLAGLGGFDRVGFAERGEGLIAVRVADDDVSGDVVQVEGAGGQTVTDGDGVIGVDGRIDARQGPLLGEAPAEGVDAGTDAAGVGAEGTVGVVPGRDAGVGLVGGTPGAVGEPLLQFLQGGDGPGPGFAAAQARGGDQGDEGVGEGVCDVGGQVGRRSWVGFRSLCGRGSDQDRARRLTATAAAPRPTNWPRWTRSASTPRASSTVPAG
ncbi:hypothetical protein GCM10027294_41340 [Marinactinospora endophytica]